MGGKVRQMNQMNQKHTQSFHKLELLYSKTVYQVINKDFTVCSPLNYWIFYIHISYKESIS